MCVNTNVSTELPVHNGLKQGAALRPLLLKTQEGQNQEILKFSGTHHLLIYADDVDLLAENISSIRESTSKLCESKEVGPQINIEKTKYMLMSRHQNSGKSNNTKIADESS